MQTGTHISDSELVLAADGELTERRLMQVRSHLAACEACRARARELDDALADFIRAQRSSSGPLPSAHASRAELRARLDALAAQPPSRRLRVPVFPGPRILWTGAGIAAVLVLFAGLVIVPRIARRTEEVSGIIPNTRLTPGTVLTTDARNVCAAASAEHAHFIPAATGQRVFAEYGIRSPRPRAYELDYLIAPELGGSDDIRNFWPQPYSAAVWNSHVKDALEDRLHDLVCSGQLSLRAAQRDISTDWVAAYKKYFNTQGPLPDHYAFAKDMPWVE
jgi:hypothetical protein